MRRYEVIIHTNIYDKYEVLAESEDEAESRAYDLHAKSETHTVFMASEDQMLMNTEDTHRIDEMEQQS